MLTIATKLWEAIIHSVCLGAMLTIRCHTPLGALKSKTALALGPTDRILNFDLDF